MFLFLYCPFFEKTFDVITKFIFYLLPWIYNSYG